MSAVATPQTRPNPFVVFISFVDFPAAMSIAGRYCACADEEVPLTLPIRSICRANFYPVVDCLVAVHLPSRSIEMEIRFPRYQSRASRTLLLPPSRRTRPKCFISGVINETA
jgi:hypothetical protein